MNRFEKMISHINKQALKVIGKPLFNKNQEFQSDLEFLISIRKKWIQLFLHPNGKVLSFSWLMTHFSSQQLIDGKIYLSGIHTVIDDDAFAGGDATIFHKGNGKIYAAGKAIIKDFGTELIYVGDEVRVNALKSKRIFAKGFSYVSVCSNYSVIHVWQKASICTDKNTTIKAYGDAHVVSKDGGYITAKGHASIDVFSHYYCNGYVEFYDNSTGFLYGKTNAVVANEAKIEAFDNCNIIIKDKGIVFAYDDAKVISLSRSKIHSSDKNRF